MTQPSDSSPASIRINCAVQVVLTMSGLNYAYASDMYGSGKGINSKLSALLFQGGTLLCAGQILGGVLVAVVSFAFLFTPYDWIGAILGAAVGGAGAVGIWGTLQKSRDVLNFHIVGAILGLVLCAEFVGELGRGVQTDCALGELFLRTSMLEDLTKNLARHDMFASVHDRLNELEEAIEIVNFGVDSTVEFLRDGGDDPNRVEKDYIRNKIEVIRHHANEIVDEIKNSPETDAEKVKKWPPADRSRLQIKLATAEHILDRIARHDEDSKANAFSAEEYERMLQTLLNILRQPSVPGKYENMDLPQLNELTDELGVTKSVIEKISEGVNALDELKADTTELTAQSRKRREDYAKEFGELLSRDRSRHQENVNANALDYMPEHCIKEMKAFRYLSFLCMVIACLQLMTIYASLSISFRIPLKSD